MLSTLGWLGSIMLGICSLPQAIKCYRDGNSDGLSWGFIGLWLGGELLTLIYVLGSSLGGSGPLLLNYAMNIVLIGLMIKYKLYPRG
jgi:uncharacterized protein with PQ loop repeat